MSYDYVNFYKALEAAGYKIKLFDYMDIMQQHGKKAVNNMLLEIINSFRPTVAIFSLYTDQIDEYTVMQAGRYTRTFVICENYTGLNPTKAQ